MEVYIKKKPIWVSVRGGFRKEVNFAPDPSANALIRRLVELMNGKDLEGFSVDENSVTVELKIRKHSKMEVLIGGGSLSVTLGFTGLDEAHRFIEFFREVDRFTGLRVSAIFERYLTRRSIVTVMVQSGGDITVDEKVSVEKVNVAVSGEFNGGFSCTKDSFTGFGLFADGEDKVRSLLGC